MDSSSDYDNGAALPSDFTIAHVLQAKAPLMAQVEAGCHVIDLSAMTHIDGAGLQLLLLARREADTRGFAFEGVIPSRAVSTALALARLGNDLRPLPQHGAAPVHGKGSRS